MYLKIIVFMLVFLAAVALCLVVSFVVYAHRALSKADASSGFFRPQVDVEPLLPSPFKHALSLAFVGPLYSAYYLALFLGKLIRVRGFRRAWHKPLRLSDAGPLGPRAAPEGPPQGIGMIVFLVHGLGEGPCAAFPYVDELKRQIPPERQGHYVVCAPPLYRGGNAPPKEVAYRLFHDHVKKELAKAPLHIPLTLLGTSLGGLIALHLRLLVESGRRVHVAAVGAPLKGTLWLDAALLLKQRSGLDPLPLHPALKDELKYRSLALSQLLGELRGGRFCKTTRYVFASSVNDHLVLPFVSALPDMRELAHDGEVLEDARQHYIVLFGTNHLGLSLEAASKVVKALFIDWESASV